MKRIKKILGILVLIILLPILFVNGVILIDSVVHPDEIPSFFGWKPFIVLSGSMENEIRSGDLAIVKEIEDETIKENDIIAYKDGEVVVTHRVIEVVKENEEVKYKTKGDNNTVEDKGYVTQDKIEGLFQFKISKVGNLAMFIQTPIGMIISLSIPVGILIFMQKKDSNSKEVSNKEKDLQAEIERLKKQNEELKKK